MRRLVLVVLLLMAAACDRLAGPPADGPGGMITVQINEDQFKTRRLEALSQEIREVMRRQPMVILEPINGRRVEGDHVVIQPSDPARVDLAMVRLSGINGVVATSAGDRRIEVRLTEERLAAERDDATTKSAEILKRRMSQAGFRALVEPSPTEIKVKIPGLSNPRQLGELSRMMSLTGDLSFHLVDEQETAAAYSDPARWPMADERDGRIALPDDSRRAELVVIMADPIIRGEDLKTVSQGFDASNQPNIIFELNDRGKRLFGEATTQNVGRQFAIVLNGRIVSAPNIRSPITGGTGTIEGGFTLERAQEIAMILRTGSLPAPLRLVDRSFYGASPKGP